MGLGLRHWVIPAPAACQVALDPQQASGSRCAAPGREQGQSHSQRAPARRSCSSWCPAHSGCLNKRLCSWDETEAQVSIPGLKPFEVPRFTEKQACSPWAASPHLRAAAAPRAQRGCGPCPLVSAASLLASLWGSRGLRAWGPSALAGCREACCLRRSGRAERK